MLKAEIFEKEAEAEADSSSSAAPIPTGRATGQPTDILTSAEIKSLDQRFNDLPTEEILAWAWERFGPRAAIGTSFQGAGLAMIHLARENHLDFPVFTLDTGLLFPETVALKKRLEDFFVISIEALEPDLT